MKDIIKTMGLNCPDCDKGLLISVVRKNWYHGRKSNCRKTKWKRCSNCNYNKFVGIKEDSS